MGKAVHRAIGEQAIYESTDTYEPVDCLIIVEHDALLQPEGADYEITEVGITVDALFSDVGAPKIGSTFETGSALYTVKRIEGNDRIFVKVVVTEDEH